MSSEHQPLLSSAHDARYGSPPPQTSLLSPETKGLIKSRMYFSHSLYVWNSRAYEFGIVLFIINLYPGTLLPPSLFALISTGSCILLSNAVTKLVNMAPRLTVIKRTIFIQRLFAVASATSLLIIFAGFKHRHVLKATCLVVVIVCGAVERLCTIANKISINRDWLVKIATDDKPFLLELNTRMRSIDLFCKLLGPLFISTFLTVTNHEITAVFLIVAFMVSGPLEYTAIVKIYDVVPLLQTNSKVTLDTHNITKMNYWQSVKLFTQTPMSLALLAMSLLYCTVLSFGNSTVAYLLSFDDINNMKIGILKAISTVFELLGTMLIFPLLNHHFGLINTGFMAVFFQFISLFPIAVSFFIDYPRTHWLMCLFIPFSRIGLWCFDLSVQNSVQLLISGELERFNATTFEETLNNTLELCGYVLTLWFHRPEQFRWPVYVSVSSVGLAVVLYGIFFFRVRGQKTYSSA